MARPPLIPPSPQKKVPFPTPLSFSPTPSPNNLSVRLIAPPLRALGVVSLLPPVLSMTPGGSIPASVPEPFYPGERRTFPLRRGRISLFPFLGFFCERYDSPANPFSFSHLFRDSTSEGLRNVASFYSELRESLDSCEALVFSRHVKTN